MKTLNISLTIDDALFLCNAIGEAWEVVHGNEVEFNSRTHQTSERADEIRSRLEQTLQKTEHGSKRLHDNKIHGKRFQFSVSFEDLLFLCSATKMALEGIERWEFHTRTGRTPEEALKILRYLQMMVDEAAGTLG